MPQRDVTWRDNVYRVRLETNAATKRPRIVLELQTGHNLIATVDAPDALLKNDQALIRNDREHAGLLEALCAAGVTQDTRQEFCVGGATLSIVNVLPLADFEIHYFDWAYDSRVTMTEIGSQRRVVVRPYDGTKRKNPKQIKAGLGDAVANALIDLTAQREREIVNVAAGGSGFFADRLPRTTWECT